MGFLEERDMTDVPTIPEFYKGKNIFITGGSGFMGKVLIEKLLYSCSDLDKIYLLLRTKKNVKPSDRLKDIYSSPCFDRLRKEKPRIFESKVVVVAGDVVQTGLGLSKDDRELIVRKVNIIFHAAASVRFDDLLSTAAGINMRSTIEIIEIAKEMKNLNVFVHVSTAFANCKWKSIEEKIYPPYVNWRDTLEVCETLDEKTLQCFTPKYIKGVPNTYIFTKQLAEHIVYEQKGKLPIVITRPSIVISTLVEPMPGWIENFNGPVGIFMGVNTGVLRCLLSSVDQAPDYVPVDACIKHFIAAAWFRGTKKLEPSDDIEIYNCCSMKKITNGQLLQYAKEIATIVPFEKALWILNCSFTSSKYIYYFMLIFCHLIPAAFFDMMLWISGRKPMIWNLQKKIFISNMILQTFMLTEWTFNVDNFIKLRSYLKEEDLQDFYFDFNNFLNKEHFIQCAWGGKKYLLKEKKENLPKAIAQMKRLNVMDKVLRYTTYALITWAIIKYYALLNPY